MEAQYRAGRGRSGSAVSREGFLDPGLHLPPARQVAIHQLVEACIVAVGDLVDELAVHALARSITPWFRRNSALA